MPFLGSLIVFDSQLMIILSALESRKSSFVYSLVKEKYALNSLIESKTHAWPPSHRVAYDLAQGHSIFKMTENSNKDSELRSPYSF